MVVDLKPWKQTQRFVLEGVSPTPSLPVMQNQSMMEMKTRLEELHMEHEYQLRLKVMSYNEKMRELSDKLTQQAETMDAMKQVCCSPTHDDEEHHLHHYLITYSR